MPDNDAEVDTEDTVMVEVDCGPETVIRLVTNEVLVAWMVESPELLKWVDEPAGVARGDETELLEVAPAGLPSDCEEGAVTEFEPVLESVAGATGVVDELPAPGSEKDGEEMLLGPPAVPLDGDAMLEDEADVRVFWPAVFPAYEVAAPKEEELEALPSTGEPDVAPAPLLV